MNQAKLKAMPKDDFGSVIYILTMVAFVYPVSLLGTGLVKAITWCCRSIKGIRDKRRARESNAVMEAEAETEPTAQETQEVVSAQSLAANWDNPEIQASDIRMVEMDGGYAVFRFNKQTGSAKGKLTVTSRTLQKAIGRDCPLNLTNLASLAEATDAVRGKAEAILASGRTKKVGVKGAKALVESCASGNRDAVPMEMPAMQDIPYEAMQPEIPPYFIDDESASMGPDPFEGLSEIPETVASTPIPKEAPAPKRKKVKGQFQVKYQGTVMGFGREERKLDDPKKGERLVNHFCLRIYDEVLQAEHPLWGNDLQRVLKEENVKVGDRIELGVVGETEVMVRGKPAKKKVWALNKV